MEKEAITQQDAVLLLLKCRPNINFSAIQGELPKYYRKNLPGTIQDMVNSKLLDYDPKQDGLATSWHYSLAKKGKKALDYRFAKLRNDSSTRKQLGGLVYAFGM
jgi:hypothetical protein